MKSVPLQDLLAASAPLVAIVGDRISKLSRFTGEGLPAVVHEIASDESAAIDDSERMARVSVAVVTTDDEIGENALAICVEAIFAGIGANVQGVTLVDVVPQERSFEINFDDGNGNETTIPVHAEALDIFYRLTPPPPE